MRYSRSLLLLAAVAMSASRVLAQTEPSLAIGSEAPAIDVDHWFDLRPRGAEGEPPAPITGFESGKVYVLEFWATWCGPCIMSIPHINDLQQRYRDRGVTVVSISDEDVATVEPFFNKEVLNYPEGVAPAPKYRDLMAAYRVGVDPDGSVNRDYMEAAGQSGIPCAFLVGKTGLIEWIGHPMELDSVLEAVVTDAWDRDAFAEKFAKQQRIGLLEMALNQAIQSGAFDRARELGTEVAALAGNPEFVDQVDQTIERVEFNNLLMTNAAAAKTRLAELLTAYQEDAGVMDEFAWHLYQQKATGKPIERDILKTTVESAEAIVDPAAPNASLLDTLAHLRHSLGDLDAAIAHQNAAVAAMGNDFPPQLRQRFAGYLAELRAEKAAADSNSQQPRR